VKTTYLVFAMIGCAASMHGASYAAASTPALQQASSDNHAKIVADSLTNFRRTDPHDSRHAGSPGNGKRRAEGNRLTGTQQRRSGLVQSYQHGHPSRAKSNGANQLPHTRQRYALGSAVSPHRSEPDKSATAAQRGLIQNERVNNTPSVRPPSHAPPSASSLSNVRHRGPNPAFVGGTANSKTANAGAIDGTHMIRRP
jgi:hypothetical protein